MIQTVAGMKQDLNDAIESGRTVSLHMELCKGVIAKVNNLQTIMQDQYNRKEVHATCPLSEIN
jgi:hypothetical protein